MKKDYGWQRVFIENQLKNNNEISRNLCLENRITRLGAWIHRLRSRGWDFVTYWRGGDYVYKVTKTPENKG